MSLRNLNELRILSREVLADISSAGWLEQELHPELDRHRRHQIADICQPDNVERVWRVLGLSVAEARIALLRILQPLPDLLTANELERPECWTFSFRVPLQPDSLTFLKEKIHEYLVAAVMTDRTAVIIPAASATWQTRAATALSSLSNFASTDRSLGRARRPLWP